MVAGRAPVGQYAAQHAQAEGGRLLHFRAGRTLSVPGRVMADPATRKEHPMICYECDCTDDRACLMPDGTPCWWTRPNLCSKCFTRITQVEHDPTEQEYPQKMT